MRGWNPQEKSAVWASQFLDLLAHPTNLGDGHRRVDLRHWLYVGVRKLILIRRVTIQNRELSLRQRRSLTILELQGKSKPQDRGGGEFIAIPERRNDVVVERLLGNPCDSLEYMALLISNAEVFQSSGR